MTCNPLSSPEDLKVLIREGITKLCPPDLVKPSYEALRFFLSPGDPGSQGLHLLVGLQVLFEVHMHLRDVLLCQPDFISDNLGTTLPCLEPPFADTFVPSGLGAPPQHRTPGEVADLLKARFRPPSHRGKET